MALVAAKVVEGTGQGNRVAEGVGSRWPQTANGQGAVAGKVVLLAALCKRSRRAAAALGPGEAAAAAAAEAAVATANGMHSGRTAAAPEAAEAEAAAGAAAANSMRRGESFDASHPGIRSWQKKT